MDVKIVDITLRAGEQLIGKALKPKQKILLASLLDSTGVSQLEAGIPAMGADARKSMASLAAAGLKCRVSAWNRLDLNDIQTSMECGMDIVHISVPSSDMEISRKLDKTREWVLDYLRKCIYTCRAKGYEVTIGLEDASRADREFLYELIGCSVAEGVRTVRYADTAGMLFRTQTYEELKAIKEHFDIELEMHVHNEFGLAVANSIAAVRAGAELVSCSIGGIGPGVGNCNLLDFVKAACVFLGACREFDLERIKEVQKVVLSTIKY